MILRVKYKLVRKGQIVALWYCIKTFVSAPFSAPMTEVLHSMATFLSLEIRKLFTHLPTRFKQYPFTMLRKLKWPFYRCSFLGR